MSNRRAFLLMAASLTRVTFGADRDFTHWWRKFRAAVADSDGKAIAEGSRFPLPWENGSVRTIRTAADLVQKFDLYFTPEVRRAVARRKPELLANGEYIVSWKARGNEYSLYFDPDGSGSFRLSALSEGPG